MNVLGKRIVLFVIALIVVINAFLTTPVHAQQVIVDDLKFVEDVTIPDGKIVNPGETFVKTWKFKNIGSTIWNTQYTFRFADYWDPMSGTPSVQFLVANVAPQNTVDISVTMTAPTQPGKYTSYWQMHNAQGIGFGPKVWVSITVPDTTSTNTLPSANPQATPQPQNFDFRRLSSNAVELYYQGQWIAMTPSPNGIYEIQGQAGQIGVLEYKVCTTDWSSWSWSTLSFGKKCETQTESFLDLGLRPVYFVSEEGEAKMYAYLSGLTFNTVAISSGETLVGTNGYIVAEIGAANSFNVTTVMAAASRFALPVTIVAYVYYRNKMFTVFHPANEIVAVPVPVAPIVITSVEIPPYVMQSLNQNPDYTKPRIGSSAGMIKNDLSSFGLMFLSLPNKCSMNLDVMLPKNDLSQLLNFKESQEEKRPCNIIDWIIFLMKIGKQAFEAGVGMEFIKQMYTQVLSKLILDFGVSGVDGNLIVQLLDL